MKSDSRIKPIIKWAGGKSQILPEIRQRYPKGLGKTIKKYAEPFIGGAAVLLDILSTYELDEVLICDTNAELINLYKTIRDNADIFVEQLRNYRDEFIPLTPDERKQYYYTKRTRFNDLKRASIYSIEMATLFVFINKTCFNGLYRVNSKGDYNVPMGAYKEPPICDESNLRQVSKVLKGVQIEYGDYHVSESFIDDKTFVYFDPPYRPLSQTASFTSYTEDCFDDSAQTKLAQYIIALANKGAHVLASNSDPKNTDINDNFFDDLYAPLTIERITATRMINSNAGGRGKISEILVHN
jgi:DNA adenine methylase